MLPLPKWTYVSLFIPSEFMFVQVDEEISAFVTRAKGIDKTHNTVHMSDPIS